eukprot:gb/GFBE01039405.1/.p1 GENE.gb/GFBE01039405.1/~~gb/GFBE01039405.1/.p1  ORF type:complete len:437 (+),score=161.84 gb/GFBE01039405.1/:1-1311(+)
MAPNRSSLGSTLAAGLALAAVWSFAPRREVDDLSFVGSSVQPPQVREHKVALNGVDKAMKDRINSVEKTGKLTDAMRLVAAAKVRRAQDGVKKSRPFSEELTSMIKGIVKKLKGSGMEAELPMLRVPEKVTQVGILMVTSNRGLCGGYNAFIVKKAKARIQTLNDQGIVPKLIVIGNKGKMALTQRMYDVNFNYTGTFFDFPDTLKANLVSNIGDAVRNLFLSGEVDKVEVVSAKFFNLVKNEPTIRTMLPLTPTGIEDPGDETFTLTSEDGKLKVEKEKVKSTKAKEIENDVIFDQTPDVILNSMLPLYLNSQLLSILFDSQASELSSRMTAMKAATDNAKEVKKKLLRIFHKKRQASITAEIAEISAGALSMEDGDKSAGPPLGLFDNEETAGEDFLKELESGDVPDSPPMPEGPEDRMELFSLQKQGKYTEMM